MAIARAPKQTPVNPTVVDEKKIDELINKGGSPTRVKDAPAVVEEDPIKTVLVRTYESQLKEIDQWLLQIPKRNRPSRNGYIVEAIEEKMQRDKNKRK